MIFTAVEGPMPLTEPLARYFSIWATVPGIRRSHSSARNWRPKVEWESQWPDRRSSSPAEISGRTPTTVMSSPSSVEMSSTVKPVSSLRNTSSSATPSRTSSCSSITLRLLLRCFRFVERGRRSACQPNPLCEGPQASLRHSFLLPSSHSEREPENFDPIYFSFYNKKGQAPACPLLCDLVYKPSSVF